MRARRWAVAGIGWLCACSAAAPAREPPVAEPRVEPGAAPRDDPPPAAAAPPEVTIGADAAEQHELIERIERACAPPEHDYGAPPEEMVSRCRAIDNACIDVQPALQALIAEGEPEPRARALRAAASVVASAQCASPFRRDRCTFMVPSGSVPVDTTLCDSLRWVPLALSAAARSGDPAQEAAAAEGFARDTTRPDLAIPVLQALLQRALKRRDADSWQLATTAVGAATTYRAAAAPLLPELREVIDARPLMDDPTRGSTLLLLAVSAVGQIGGPESIALLTIALDDVLSEVRAVAAGSLAVMASRGIDIGPALPALRRRAQDRDQRVRQTANSALSFHDQMRR